MQGLVLATGEDVLDLVDSVFVPAPVDPDVDAQAPHHRHYSLVDAWSYHERYNLLGSAGTATWRYGSGSSETQPATRERGEHWFSMTVIGESHTQQVSSVDTMSQARQIRFLGLVVSGAVIGGGISVRRRFGW
jgi:hypothetical protein